jgi:hypothetical protein
MLKMPPLYYLSDRADDWRAPNGDILSPPATDAERLFSTAYSYCVENWCVNDVSESLFTYGTGEGESFEDLNKCDVLFSSEVEDAVQAIVDDPTANQELSDACDGSLSCLVDGVCGSIEDARQALENEVVIVETQVEVKTDLFLREQVEVVDVVAITESPSASPSNSPSKSPTTSPIKATTTTTTTATSPAKTTTSGTLFWYPAWGKGSLESACLNDGEAPQTMKVSGKHLHLNCSLVSTTLSLTQCVTFVILFRAVLRKLS